MFEDEKFNKKFDELVLIVNELMQLKEKYKEKEKGLSKEKVAPKETHILKDKEIITISKEDTKYIIDYLNKKLNTKYRYTGKKMNSLIRARLNEGFTLEDFKYVIDIKYDEWHKDEKMSKHLTYETLFGNKFEKYLNQTPTMKSKVNRFMKEEMNKTGELF